MEKKNMNNHKLYCCYSLPLKNFLFEHGVKYEIVALSPKTKSTMWIYIKDETLDRFLNEWSNNTK